MARLGTGLWGRGCDSEQRLRDAFSPIGSVRELFDAADRCARR